MNKMRRVFSGEVLLGRSLYGKIIVCRIQREKLGECERRALLIVNNIVCAQLKRFAGGHRQLVYHGILPYVVGNHHNRIDYLRSLRESALKSTHNDDLSCHYELFDATRRIL